MNIWEALLLGVVDAVDTMCVGASDGILEPNMKKRKMLISGSCFWWNAIFNSSYWLLCRLCI
jgi:putative Mn2+ efflux pump MntP